MNGADGFWLFQVLPHPDESLGHFLGRFRRANNLSRLGLAELLSVSGVMIRNWETPSRQRPPSGSELESLSNGIGVNRETLVQMLPPDSSQLHLGTRLCPVCYQEVPIHRRTWQYASVERCERHQQSLRWQCPACGTPLRLPALWESGICEHCWLRFSEMTDECSANGRAQ
jgi:transcriptional regulator with XRE-family HTH domain